MSTSPPPPTNEPTLEQRIHMTTSFQKFLHNASLTMLVAAPILISIPPRKLDLYTFSLAGSFVASANHLTKERTGAGLLYQLPGARMPAYALEFQERNREIAQREGRRLLEVGDDEGIRDPAAAAALAAERRARLQELERKEPTSAIGKAAKELWRGEEKDDWKAKRLAEEQKKLDEGEGYGGMIVDQIWEVWNWGEQKVEEVKEIDEKVVKQREEQGIGSKSKSKFVLDRSKLSDSERQKRWREEFPEIGKG